MQTSWRSLLTCFLLMMGDLTGLMVDTVTLLEGETGLRDTSHHNNVNMANMRRPHATPEMIT